METVKANARRGSELEQLSDNIIFLTQNICPLTSPVVVALVVISLAASIYVVNVRPSPAAVLSLQPPYSKPASETMYTLLK